MEVGLYVVYGLLVSKDEGRQGHFSRLEMLELILGERILFKLVDQLSGHPGALMDDSLFGEIF